MAAAAPSTQSDKDLASIAEARALARRAKAAQLILAEFSQAQVDTIVDAMAAAVTPCAEALARLAVDETGFGVLADKIQKNLFASKQVYEFIKPMKTVGVINRNDEKKVIEIAEPFGVVAAVIPSTNPTSTAIYKILISIKSRCAVVMTPHPSAARCITQTADVMYEAGRKAGLPDGAIGWMTTVTLEGTQELMKAREVSVILATGGMGLVRAAYSAGKPAYGVGPGNAPCYIESSADVRKAANDILTGNNGDDVLVGGGQADSLYGGDGNDVLIGGRGNDYLSGDNGNDTLIGGENGDTLLGGAGNDLLYAGNADLSASIDGGAGIDSIAINYNVSGIKLSTVKAANIERIDMNGLGSNTLTLDVLDVASVTGAKGAFANDSTWNSAGILALQSYQLIIDGDTGDKLVRTGTADRYNKWAIGGYVSNNGQLYTILNSSEAPASQLAQILVDTDIDMNGLDFDRGGPQFPGIYQLT